MPQLQTKEPVVSNHTWIQRTEYRPTLAGLASIAALGAVVFFLVRKLRRWAATKRP